MKCLYCSCTESKVVDSRSSDDARTIRRRRVRRVRAAVYHVRND